ncbi:MAG TPA: flagellar motor switch protein FliG [Bryobacteraceae bacterium]|jgi:flagellar motor switch protein FliG
MAAAAHAPVLSGIQKAAILLVSVGDHVSADLLKRLSDDEVQAVTAAIASLPAISREQAETVLEEFRASTSLSGQGHGGVDFARRILTSAFGAEGSKKHVERLPKAAGRSSDAGQRLQKLDPQLLARFVESEHPQTIALVLAHLSAGQSAAVLRSMPADLRADATIRLASLDQISPVVMNKISDIISRKLQTLGEVKRESSGGLRAVAEIFNQLDGELSNEILGQVGERDAALVESIRQKMFVFDDLMMIDPAGIKELLGRADRRQLTIALKGTGDELRKHMLQGMSQRGAAMLLEDMEALGPVKIREVEEAQQMMIALLRQLESEGVVSLKGGGDEQFIV